MATREECNKAIFEHEIWMGDIPNLTEIGVGIDSVDNVTESSYAVTLMIERRDPEYEYPDKLYLPLEDGSEVIVPVIVVTIEDTHVR